LEKNGGILHQIAYQMHGPIAQRGIELWSVAEVCRRGNENREMRQTICHSLDTPQELNQHRKQTKEANKRNHHVLSMDLLSIKENVIGSFMFHPRVWGILISYINLFASSETIVVKYSYDESPSNISLVLKLQGS
jgi:threonyl-tRNA synthetase